MDSHELQKQHNVQHCPGSAFAFSHLSQVVPYTEKKTANAVVGDAESRIPANMGFSVSTLFGDYNCLRPNDTPYVSSEDTWPREESRDSPSNTSRYLSTRSEDWHSRRGNRLSTRRDQCHGRQRNRQRSRELYRSTPSQSTSSRSRENESDPDQGSITFSRDNFDPYNVSWHGHYTMEVRHHNFDDRENDRRERSNHNFDDRENDSSREWSNHNFDDRENDSSREWSNHNFDDRENDRRERRHHNFDDRENDRREWSNCNFDDRENDRREWSNCNFDDRENDRREWSNCNFDDRENDRREWSNCNFDDRENDRRERRHHNFDDRENDRREWSNCNFDDRENDRRERRHHNFDDREDDRREWSNRNFDDRENDRREWSNRNFDDRENDRREWSNRNFDDRENDRREWSNRNFDDRDDLSRYGDDRGERRHHDFEDISNSTHQTNNFETRRNAWHGSQIHDDRESWRDYNGEEVYRTPDTPSTSSFRPYQRSFSPNYHQRSHRHSRGGNFSRNNLSRNNYSRSNSRNNHSRGNLRNNDSRSNLRNNDSRGNLRNSHSRGNLRNNDSRSNLRNNHSRDNLRNSHSRGNLRNSHSRGNLRNNHSRGNLRNNHSRGNLRYNHSRSNLRSNHSRGNSRSNYTRRNNSGCKNSWPNRRNASGSRHRHWRRRATDENAFSPDSATEIHKNSEKKEKSKPSAPMQMQHSVSRLLLSGYQRGEEDRTRMHKTVVRSTASSLQQAGQSSVFPYPESCDILGHMEHMSLNKDHNHLLCMWSIKGTALKHVRTAHVTHHAKTRCGELPLEFTLSDIMLQTFGSLTSLCWIDSPGYPDSDFVLYTVNHRSRHARMGVAYIHGKNESTGKVIDAHFWLAYKNVFSCTWNSSKEWLGAGLDGECQIVDVNTRNTWHLGSCGSKVLSQAFSKVDGGQLLYCGLHNGALLMHDTRQHTMKPTTVLRSLETQCQKICDLKVTSDESCIYTRDVAGQIRKVDLRMQSTVLTYDGLCSQQRSLPFHIDETESILYAAGTDCYTKIWSLDNGELLHSIPPPYAASPYHVPAVQFSDHWGGPMGDIGMVMGANTDMYLYSSGI